MKIKDAKEITGGLSNPSKMPGKAPNQDNECKACRLCWNSKVQNVSYLKH